MEMNFQNKIDKYFNNINDLEKLPEIVNGIIINDDVEFNENLQQLILKEGLDFVVGIITKNLVVENINKTQELIEQKSQNASESIDLIFDSLSPIFTKIKFDYLNVCKNFYGMSDEQSELFIDSIVHKHSQKEEFLNLFFNDLKKHNVFQELKDDVTQSILDEFMFAKDGKENKKAYNLAFKFKKYKDQLNQFDLFFKYLQETYKPNEIYELMSKFSIYVKTKNFHYDLLSDIIFDDEPNIESLNNLRENFKSFQSGENKSEFYQSLINRLKNIQLPAKLTTNNAIDIHSAKITFNNELPYRYTNGLAMKTPGPFVDYAVKNRCFIENNKTLKHFAFGRIMAIEPMNDIFNHQYAYRKENIAYNKLVENGNDVIVYEFQKPTLASKLTKKIITIDDPYEIDEIIDIFDNIINLARNKVEQPNFESLIVQIGKNYFDLDRLENFYEMTHKLINYINDGSISLENQSVINLIERSFTWINTCIDLETNESNLNLIYSDDFRDGVFSLAQKLNAPLQNSMFDLYSKLNPENKSNNKIKANIHIERNQLKQIESNWKDVEFFDKIIVADEMKERLEQLKSKMETISNVSADYFSTIESTFRANGAKVANMKIKFDDILKGKIESRVKSGKYYYHSVTTTFSPQEDRFFEKCAESIFENRNRLKRNVNDFTDVGNSLKDLKTVLENPIEYLLPYSSNQNRWYVKHIIDNLNLKNKDIIKLVDDGIECFSYIHKQINETTLIDKFENEKLTILNQCTSDLKELDELLKKVMNNTKENVDSVTSAIKFKQTKIN